jgi:TRAP-type C4-dicarboxylate transport system substrate-binding protein
MKRPIALITAFATTALLLMTASGSSATVQYEMSFGSMAPKGTPWMDMLEATRDRIEKDSGGRIDVIIRPPGFMGELEMVEEVRKGERLQAAGVTTAALAEGGNLPQMQLVELPYLFNNNSEADYILDKVLYSEMGNLLNRRGYVLANWSENGWRSFATKTKAIRKPSDLNGLKMRSQESDVHMAMYKTFGATAIQKPMTEVLTALNSNVIEGLDNTALFIQAGGLAEPVGHFTLTRHIYQPAAVIYSKKFYDGLPDDLQKVIMNVQDIALKGRRDIRRMEAEMMDNFDFFGVEVIELSSAEREAFAIKARGMHDSFAAGIDGGPAILAKIRDGLKQKRAK